MKEAWSQRTRPLKSVRGSAGSLGRAEVCTLIMPIMAMNSSRSMVPFLSVSTWLARGRSSRWKQRDGQGQATGLGRSHEAAPGDHGMRSWHAKAQAAVSLKQNLLIKARGRGVLTS